MASEGTGGRLLRQVADGLKAAGEPSRFRILKVLEGGELCVCHLVELLGVSQPTVSRHLAVLRHAGLVEERRDGRWTWYRLATVEPHAARILEVVAASAEDDPVVRGDRTRADDFRATPVDVFCARMREGCDG